MKPLTPKQARFVLEYLKDLNATQAAIRAGYSKRTANEQGARLLAKASVSVAVAEGKAEYAKRAEMDADEWRARVARLGRFDVRKLVDPDTGNMIPIQDLPDDIAGCVTSVKVLREKTTRCKAGDSETDLEETLVEVKPVDPLRALELYGRHLGLLKDKLEVNASSPLFALPPGTHVDLGNPPKPAIGENTQVSITSPPDGDKPA